MNVITVGSFMPNNTDPKGLISFAPKNQMKGMFYYRFEAIYEEEKILLFISQPALEAIAVLPKCIEGVDIMIEKAVLKEQLKRIVETRAFKERGEKALVISNFVIMHSALITTLQLYRQLMSEVTHGEVTELCMKLYDTLRTHEKEFFG